MTEHNDSDTPHGGQRDIRESVTMSQTRASQSAMVILALWCWRVILAKYYWRADRVPTYTSNGRRTCNRSLRDVEGLLESGYAVVTRNRRGEIVCATYREESGGLPMRETARMSTPFSVREHIGEYRVWKHDLHCGKLEHEDNDLYARVMYSAVALSCITNQRG